MVGVVVRAKSLIGYKDEHKMTIAIPNNLVRASVSVSDSGQVMTFTQRNARWQHVWRWDNVNGTLSLSQFRRGKHVVKVNHWHSANMMPGIIEARRTLRKEFSQPQWFGREAVNHLNRAFTH